MSIKAKKFTALFLPVLVVVVLDQVTKYLVRTNSDLHYYEIIEGWLALNFTKNPGMALGMDWLSTPVISVVAILATIGILGYIFYTINNANIAYLICMGLIVGGAIGNIIDRITMGIVGGYGGILEGHVVDFIHFTLQINSWSVFPYIFNVADVAISTSIIILLIFHKKIMPLLDDEKTDAHSELTEHSASGKTVPEGMDPKIVKNSEDEEESISIEKEKAGSAGEDSMDTKK